MNCIITILYEGVVESSAVMEIEKYRNSYEQQAENYRREVRRAEGPGAVPCALFVFPESSQFHGVGDDFHT